MNRDIEPLSFGQLRKIAEQDGVWPDIKDGIEQLTNSGVTLWRARKEVMSRYYTHLGQPVAEDGTTLSSIPADVPKDADLIDVETGEYVPTFDDLQDVDEAMSKGTTPHKEIMWVNKVLGLDPTQVTVEMAPSLGAWGIYQWARSSKMNRKDFYAQLYRPCLPTRRELDQQSNATDGVDEIEEMIARCHKHRNEILGVDG